MRRVLVTGSRGWTSRAAIAIVLRAYAAEVNDGLLVVHGGARGADALADEVAREYGWTTEVHPALWGVFGKRAGFERNKLMVDLGADICLAFIMDGSPGATMCAGLAEEAGIPVRRYEARR